MKHSQDAVEVPSSLPKRLAIIGSAVGGGCSLASWIFLLAVLEPHRWLPLASFARWPYIAVGLVLVVYILFLPLALRFVALTKTSPIFSWASWGAVLQLATIIALLRGRFALALILSYGIAVRPAKKSLLDAPEVAPKLRRIERLSHAVSLLTFPLLAATLIFHSLALALLLFGTESAQATLQIPLLREQIRRSHIQSQLARK